MELVSILKRALTVLYYVFIARVSLKGEGVALSAELVSGTLFHLVVHASYYQPFGISDNWMERSLVFRELVTLGYDCSCSWNSVLA